MAASRIGWPSVLAWRVRRQQLAERAPRGEALSVVERIAGLHAQLTASAELTLWARVSGMLRGGFGELLKPAAFRGELCFAPSDGRNVRFARPDQWLGAWEPVDVEHAARRSRAATWRHTGPRTARRSRAGSG